LHPTRCWKRKRRRWFSIGETPLYDCRCEARLLDDAEALRELCLAVCSTPGLTPVGLLCHQFGSALEPAGATGAVVLAELHLAVHTWPEAQAVTLDLYVCNFSQENQSTTNRALSPPPTRAHPALAHRADPPGDLA
jgi:S-adenosylmethionine/arginine decarboxylase-like enzyme